MNLSGATLVHRHKGAKPRVKLKFDENLGEAAGAVPRIVPAPWRILTSEAERFRLKDQADVEALGDT